MPMNIGSQPSITYTKWMILGGVTQYILYLLRRSLYNVHVRPVVKI
jgi:hypothetical protein